MKIPPPGRLLDIGGRRLHIQIAGSGTPVVVLESGIAASSVSWSILHRCIAELTTVISYDRAGFGWSDPPAKSDSRSRTARDAARDLARMLECAGLPAPYVLVGHSFGALIARVFEQSWPDRVTGLVLVDPVARSEWRMLSAPRKKMLARGVSLSRRGAILARLGIVGFALRLLTSGSRTVPKLLARLSAGQGRSVTERLTTEVAKMPKELWPAIAQHWSEPRSFRAMAAALENLPVSVNQLDEQRTLGDLPVIVLSAPTASPAALAEHIRDSGLSSSGQHVLVPDAAHWVQLDAPDVVVAAIARVVRIVRGRPRC